MEVRVDTYVEELATGIRKMINRAYVVMVAIDENGRALPVPGLILESPEQEAEWEGGKRRYELRKRASQRGLLKEALFFSKKNSIDISVSYAL